MTLPRLHLYAPTMWSLPLLLAIAALASIPEAPAPTKLVPPSPGPLPAAVTTPGPAASLLPIYGAPGTLSLSELEEQISAALPKGQKLDPALSLAARDVAQRAATAQSLDRATDPAALRLSLARAGAIAAEVAPLVVRSSSTAQALESLRENLVGGALGSVGVGAASHGEIVTLVVLSAPQRLQLDPFPVQVAVGSVHPLSGRVLPPLQDGEVYIYAPGGTPVRLPAAGKAPRFSVPIAFAVPGRYTLEVIGNGRRGPEVAALLEVFAGEEIPSESGYEGVDATQAPIGVNEGEAWTAEAINTLRKQRGLAPLGVDPALGRIARRYAAELLQTGEFAHQSALTGSLTDRLRAARYPFRQAGENLGQAPDVRGAHRSIVHSPAHLANLLEKGWEVMGLGVAEGRLPSGQEAVILVQVFARSK